MSPATRTCVGCGRKTSKDTLRRFVARDGVVTQDPTGHAEGRGVYTCARQACVEAAARRGGFARGLRANVVVSGSVEALFEPG
ncbi:MAG: YlxR family protein [Gaiellales bacterium]